MSAALFKHPLHNLFWKINSVFDDISGYGDNAADPEDPGTDSGNERLRRRPSLLVQRHWSNVIVHLRPRRSHRTSIFSQGCIILFNIVFKSKTFKYFGTQWYKGSHEFYRHYPMEDPPTTVVSWSNFNIEVKKKKIVFFFTRYYAAKRSAVKNALDTKSTGIHEAIRMLNPSAPHLKGPVIDSRLYAHFIRHVIIEKLFSLFSTKPYLYFPTHRHGSKVPLFFYIKEWKTWWIELT